MAEALLKKQEVIDCAQKSAAFERVEGFRSEVDDE
jgi:hypothetical protein